MQVLAMRSALVATMLISSIAVAGSLTPPGTPAPTMKPLSDVEPRTAIRLANLPLTISTPGSYYLAENIAFATTNQVAITITSSNVTIDLNGFALVGPGRTSGTSGNAIVSSGNLSNVIIRNGGVRNWRGDGINLVSASSCILEEIQTNNNAADGMDLGFNMIVKNCVSAGNGGSGIVVREGSTITNSVSRDNTLSGFVLFDGQSMISNSNAYNNTLDGISGATNDPANGCTIQSCTSSGNDRNGIAISGGNTITGCTLLGNGGDGIQVTNGNTIENCTVADSGLDGIDIGSGNYVRSNTCRTNGLSGNAAGIIVGGSDNRIESNHLDSNLYGVYLSAERNLVVMNSIRNTTAANRIRLFGSNQIGPIETSGGTITPNAWANFGQ